MFDFDNYRFAVKTLCSLVGKNEPYALPSMDERDLRWVYSHLIDDYQKNHSHDPNFRKNLAEIEKIILE